MSLIAFSISEKENDGFIAARDTFKEISNQCKNIPKRKIAIYFSREQFISLNVNYYSILVRKRGVLFRENAAVKSKHIGVLGSDPFTINTLHSQWKNTDFCFHDLVEYASLWEKNLDIDELYITCLTAAKAIDRPLDGVLCSWDFPLSTLLPFINKQMEMPGASIESVFKCEHKYWSRLVQRECIPEHIPPFQVFDPRKPGARDEPPLQYPFWMKPIKASSSYLGFYVGDDVDYHKALDFSCRFQDNFANAFNQFLNRADIPDDIRAVDGYHYLAEGIISEGLQCTQEGYVWDGEVVVYGTIDSLRYKTENESCFRSYQYPSVLPDAVIDRMTRLTETAMQHIGYDQAPFNIEYYWNPKTDRISLLEINPRISRSHCPLFKLVDGISNARVSLDAGLGREPKMPYRMGDWPYASKLMVRHFSNGGVVKRVPSPAEIKELQKRYPEMSVILEVQVGDHLSDLNYQDSYSYELASVFLGGADPEDLEKKMQDVEPSLHFDISEMMNPLDVEAEIS